MGNGFEKFTLTELKRKNLKIIGDSRSRSNINPTSGFSNSPKSDLDSKPNDEVSIKKRNKYGNVKVEYDGFIFDSKKEKDYYIQMIQLQNIGEVIKIERQVVFNFIYNEIKIFFLRLDFVITYASGLVDYVDIKPFDKKTNKFIPTPEFKLKKKLINAQYSIDIRMV